MRGRMWFTPAIVLASGGLVGCLGAPEDRAPDTWLLSAEPLVAIGRVEGDPRYLFDRVADAVLLPDGSVAVADRGSASVRVYDAGGTFQVEMGRRGEGPGEFRYINGLSLFGADTLAVYDPASFRLTTLTSDGTLVATLDVRGEGGRNPELFLGRFSNGDLGLGAIAWSAERDPTVPEADRMPIARFGADGALRSTLITATGMVRHSNGPVPFSPRLHAFVYRDSIYFTDGVDAITVADGAGAIARTIELPFSAVGYDEARTLLEASIAARAGSGAPGPLGRWQRQDKPPEQPVPLVADVLLDAAGRFWLKRYDPARDSNDLVTFDRRAGGEWWVLEAEGSVVAVAELPDGFTPTDVRADLVVGVSRDELGVERVLVFEIVRREAG